jgi:hypothetical protein
MTTLQKGLIAFFGSFTVSFTLSSLTLGTWDTALPGAVIAIGLGLWFNAKYLNKKVA